MLAPARGEALADRLRSRWAVFAAPPGALEAIIERLATMGPSTRAGVAAIAAAVTGATARPD